jgi:hypothetical protein
MAKAKIVKSNTINPSFFLQISLGIFFFVLGLFGVLPNVQESIFSLSDSNLAVELIFGLTEIACGIILVAGLFLYGQKKLLSLAGLVIFIFWAARIFVSKFVFGFKMVDGGFSFAGGFEQWILGLLVELIILVSIFSVREKYSN